MSRLVLYHGSCYDGVTAAVVCYMKFGDNDTEYIPVYYGQEPPPSAGKDVIIVDFCYPIAVLEEIMINSSRFTLLDHHATAKSDVDSINKELIRPQDFILFDMNRSGAGLAWDYFFPKKTRPILVDYIEDRDLWRFALPDSKQVNAWYQSHEINLHHWIKEVLPRKNDPKVAHEGISLLRQQAKYVREIANTSVMRRIPSTDNLVPYAVTSVLMSEVCHELIQRYPQIGISMYGFHRGEGVYQYGLRSKGDIDISIVAKRLGGGGHKNAAGFQMDYLIT